MPHFCSTQRLYESHASLLGREKARCVKKESQSGKRGLAFKPLGPRPKEIFHRRVGPMRGQTECGGETAPFMNRLYIEELNITVGLYTLLWLKRVASYFIFSALHSLQLSHEWTRCTTEEPRPLKGYYRLKSNTLTFTQNVAETGTSDGSLSYTNDLYINSVNIYGQ